MYSDPSLIRKNRVTLYLNDAEAELIAATKNYLGTETAPMLREMLIASIHRVLAGEANLSTSQAGSEQPQKQLFGSF